MTTWTSDELKKVGTAEELEIASIRRDGTLRRPVTIWVVRVGMVLIHERDMGVVVLVNESDLESGSAFSKSWLESFAAGSGIETRELSRRRLHHAERARITLRRYFAARRRARVVHAQDTSFILAGRHRYPPKPETHKSNDPANSRRSDFGRLVAVYQLA